VETAKQAGDTVEAAIDEVASWEWVEELTDPEFWKCVGNHAASLDSAITIGVAATRGGAGVAVAGGLIVAESLVGCWGDYVVTVAECVIFDSIELVVGVHQAAFSAGKNTAEKTIGAVVEFKTGEAEMLGCVF
ncbi:MAG TPA: hypothetical protein VI796_06770, partial [Candidatus Thermoplasmatota archaeon]|nr:hypothetical protein [Candidatus Thermoplasmatota archaeon]